MFKKRIFKYIQSFGVINGIALFFKIRRSRKHGIIQFNIPGLTYPVYLRRDSSDFDVFEEVFIDAHYQNVLNKNLTFIIDAGANIGLTSLYLLKNYPKATIVCIEPESDNYQILLKNTKNYKNIFTIKKALWSNSAFLKIKNLNTHNWAFEVMETADIADAIEAITIDEILKNYGLPRIDLLKIDIEGSEKKVFEINNLWVNQVKYAIVEIHENMCAGAYDAVMNLMNHHKFSYIKNQSLYFFYK